MLILEPAQIVISADITSALIEDIMLITPPFFQGRNFNKVIALK